MIGHYESRLVKLISPINNEIFSLELNGDEIELRELISTILNLPPHSIKGLRDCFGNYYTLSSAIKNPHLTSEFSSFYVIVVANNISLPHTKESSSRYKPQINSPLLPINGISPIRNGASSNETNSHSILEQCMKLAFKLNKSKLIDDKNYDKLKRMIIEENEEIISLFSLYLKHGNDMKALASQVLNIIGGKNDGFNRDENISFTSVLDSIEEQFESKSDVNLLRKLLLCDNKQIISVMDQYESDGDQKKLVNSLNGVLGKYRARLSENRPFNSQTSILDLKVNESPDSSDNKKQEKEKEKEEKENKKIEKIEKKINKILSSQSDIVRFDICELIKIEIKFLNIDQKKTLFNDVIKVKESSSINEEVIGRLSRYYEKKLYKEFLSNLSQKEVEIYNALVEGNDYNLVDLLKEYENNKSLSDFQNKIKEYIEEVIKEQMKHYNKEENDDEEDEVEDDDEEEENDSNESNDSSSINQESDDEKKSEESSEHIVTKNKKKLNENNIINLCAPESKEESRHSTERSVNKKLNDFIKVINSMAFSEENKKQILDMLSNKNEKMLKIFENYQKNKLSLKKKVLLDVIGDSKKETPSSQSPGTVRGFKTIMDKIMYQGIIKKNEYNFLMYRFNQKDEMLCSVWEVYCNGKDEEDFIDNIEIFIKKYQNLITKFAGENNSKQSSQTPSVKSQAKKSSGSLSTYKANLSKIIKSKGKYNTKPKQKELIDLLIRKNLIPSTSKEILYSKIDNEEQVIISAFEVFSVTLNHIDFAETVNLSVKSPEEGDDKYSYILEVILKEGNFSEKDKEIVRKELSNNNEMLMSILESFDKDDIDDSIETLQTFIGKVKHLKG